MCSTRSRRSAPRGPAFPSPPLEETDPRYPGFDRRYAGLSKFDLPKTECLKDTVARFLPYWHETIAPIIKSGKRVIIAAHGNSLRALVKYLDNISDEDIVGLKVGPRPDFGVDGYWLYAGDQAVLHLLGDERRSTGPTGRLDHVAFWATDLAEYVARLKRHGVDYKLRTIAVAGMHQIFLTDVDGVLVEIGFSSDEPVPADAGRTFGL